MQTASSASSTCRAFLSASEYTATVAMPILRAVLMTRHAISPRLAMRIFLNMAKAPPPCGLARRIALNVAALRPSQRNVVVLLPRIFQILGFEQRERAADAP